MEFFKNQVKEIWDDQSFVSSQMDGIASWLVALENVASNFNHFIIEHWIPAQAILVELHDTSCPTCQRVDALANNGGLASKSKQCGWAAPIPVPPPNSWSGETAPLLSPIPSLISDSSSDLAPQFFFVGARERLQTSTGLPIYINEAMGLMSSFFGGDEREAGSNGDLSEASEEFGYGSGTGGIPEGSGGHWDWYVLQCCRVSWLLGSWWLGVL